MYANTLMMQMKMSVSMVIAVVLKYVMIRMALLIVPAILAMQWTAMEETAVVDTMPIIYQLILF